MNKHSSVKLFVADWTKVQHSPHFLGLHSNLLPRVHANMSACPSPANAVETWIESLCNFRFDFVKHTCFQQYEKYYSLLAPLKSDGCSPICLCSMSLFVSVEWSSAETQEMPYMTVVLFLFIESFWKLKHAETE